MAGIVGRFSFGSRVRFDIIYVYENTRERQNRNRAGDTLAGFSFAYPRLSHERGKDKLMRELFRCVDSKVGYLLDGVEAGRIGLPDLQRPFVWSDATVRNLLDSMLKGFPIGYVMLWQAYSETRTSQIGAQPHSHVASELIIDGQQRLTGLLAALYGVKVKDSDYKERNVRICFNPLKCEFEVWSKAYDRSSEWISDISKVFYADRKDHDTITFRENYIENVDASRTKKGRPLLTKEEKKLIEKNIQVLLNLKNHLLPTVEIFPNATEEEVADIFVRVNSGGTKLTEKNFIETLLAVYDSDVRDKINAFCEASRVPTMSGTSYNPIIKLVPSHLIRAAVGIAFKRGRLKFAYKLLRGKNLETGEISDTEREGNLLKFRAALDQVTKLNDWKSFLGLFASAGYLQEALVSSENAVVFSYVLYLEGKNRFHVPPKQLARLITRWVFMATITGFYTGSTESEVEVQFKDMERLTTADEFVSYINSIINTRMTDDFFRVTVPNDLDTSSVGSPAWRAYLASLNVLGSKLMFSTQTMAQYFNPGWSGEKKAIDLHHIFPKAYLKSIGITSDRDRNQVANYTYLTYQVNIGISDNPPSNYVAEFRNKLGEEEFRKSCDENALPTGFEKMTYSDFLVARRQLMAEVIKRAFDKISIGI